MSERIYLGVDNIKSYQLDERVTWWDEPAVVKGGWREPTLWLEFPDGRTLVVGASTVRHATFQVLTDDEG